MRPNAVLFLLFAACASKDLPSFIEKCSFKKDIGKCIVDRYNTLKPRLVTGIPELKLPPIEPLKVPKMELHTGSGTNVGFDAIITDLDIMGIKDTVINEFQMDFEKKLCFIELQIPRLAISGTYDVKGKVLLFELQSKGPVTMNLTNAQTTTTFGFDLVDKDGKSYIEFKSDNIEVNANFDEAVLYFDKLFDNNDINDQVNKILNENIKDLSKEVTPVVHQASHLIVMGLVSPVFKEHSIDELFIDV